MSTPPVLLFSYGTLQKKAVQLANFGRELTGREDALPGYAVRLIPIPDPKVVAATGESHLEFCRKSNTEAAKRRGQRAWIDFRRGNRGSA